VRSKLQSPMNTCAPPAQEIFNKEQMCVRRGVGLKLGDTISALCARHRKARSKLQSPMNTCAPPAHAVFNKEQKCVRRGVVRKLGDTIPALRARHRKVRSKLQALKPGCLSGPPRPRYLARPPFPIPHPPFPEREGKPVACGFLIPHPVPNSEHHITT
jgi:hypothetical protein